jgi:predicted DNA-binding transcriptional regulator YafY
MPVKRTERLVTLVESLHAKPGMDAASLAEACGVSERTLRRDLDALGEAGFPVFFDHGYHLAAPPLLPPIGFTTDEALALGLAAQAGRPHAEPAAAQSLATAARKLQQAMLAQPLSPRPERQLALALPAAQDEGMEAVLATLTTAIGQRRTVRLGAPKGRSGPVARQVDPYRLMPSEAGWELLAYCHDRGRLLRIPLAGVGEVTILRQRFEPVPARMLTRHLHGEAAAGVRWIRLVCRPPLAQLLRKQPLTGALFWEEGAEGSVIFTIGSVDPEEFLPWLLACGESVEVLQPVELRQRIRRIAEAVAARHAPADPGAARVPSGPHRKSGPPDGGGDAAIASEDV